MLRGLRARFCPTEAIYYEDDLRQSGQDYLRANNDFFNTLGFPQRIRLYLKLRRQMIRPPQD